ncbi:MAG: FAD binding domain-containing protein, partial [Deltaproteobacteria bacterium]|nr:FAD binding domain-containing protein [Deltaproteobacteria bacterium]
MLLPKFDYHEPATLGEACQIMGDLGQKAKALAGGTDLIVNMKKKILSPACLVSLGRIKELKKIDSSNGLLKIGAGLTAAEVAETEEIKNNYSALSRGASCLGSPLIRNLATIAGNLVSARPAADFPPPLMAYGARVVLKSSSGE